MDSPTVIGFPRADGSFDDLDAAQTATLAEIDAAIVMVTTGAARRVRLMGLPFVETVAAVGLAHATSAGTAFRYEPSDDGVVTLTIGPLTLAPVPH